jgi:translation elongation factor EF-Tu-like GTPase
VPGQGTAKVSVQLACPGLAEGGRQHPIASGYRALVFWSEQADAGNDAILTWEGRQSVAPGEAGIAQLQFIHPELVAERLRVGVPVYLGEGRRIVARGVILSV